MKRIISLVLSIIMMFSLCACGKNEKPEKYCWSCGEGISKDVAFCEHCGAAVNNEKVESEDTSSDNSSSTESKTEEISRPSSTQSTSSPCNSTLTHIYDNELITKKPTCTEQGIKTYYCNSCSSTKIEQIDALGHSWKEATCTSPKQCSICKVTEGTVLKHSYSHNKCLYCEKERIVFNYSQLNLPLKIESTYPISTVATIDSLQFYIENDAIYFEYSCTIKTFSIVCFVVKILSSNKEEISSNYIEYMLVPENSYSGKKCAVSGLDFKLLNDGEYYIVISDVYGSPM